MASYEAPAKGRQAPASLSLSQGLGGGDGELPAPAVDTGGKTAVDCLPLTFSSEMKFSRAPKSIFAALEGMHSF